MTVDKTYCMSSFLMFRTIADPNKCFAEGIVPRRWTPPEDRVPVHNSEELEEHLRSRVAAACEGKRCALALSGGIDSAILAKFMPKGSVAYTFKCVVPGIAVTDETPQAAKYAAECGLEHRVVEIYWEDFEKYAPVLMKHKGCPTHSIEVQIHKAALQAKADGFDALIFGETADCIYGGHSQLLARDWDKQSFAERWSFVNPQMAIKETLLDFLPYDSFEMENGLIDVPSFLTNFEIIPSMNFYYNACNLAGVELSIPYASTIMANKLDMARVRRGENKYLVREVFQRLYPNFIAPPKTPMPRPMNEWLANWEGPTRPEFWPHCTDTMTGDQKWLVWALEKFLNMLDEEV